VELMVHVLTGFFAGELIMVNLELLIEFSMQFLASIFQDILQLVFFFPLFGRAPIITVLVGIEMVF
jgi:hypothetical protein